MSSSLGTINYMSPTKKTLHRSVSEEDSGSCDSDYNQMEVNRELFIENYLIGREGTKTRSSSLSAADEVTKELALRKNNQRRKSFMEKRSNRLNINRNNLFADKVDRNARAVIKHRMSVDINRHEYDEEYFDDEKRFVETSPPTLRKVNNNLWEFIDVELSMVSTNAL